MLTLESQSKNPEPIQALISALAEITNKPPSIQPVAEAAYTLSGYDATAEELRALYLGAGSYWLTASDSPGVWANSPRPSIGNIVNDFLNARAWATTPAAAASSAASEADRYHAEFIAPLAAMNGHGRAHLMTAPEIVRKAVHMAIGKREVSSAQYVTPELLAANMRLVAMSNATT